MPFRLAFLLAEMVRVYCVWVLYWMLICLTSFNWSGLPLFALIDPPVWNQSWGNQEVSWKALLLSTLLPSCCWACIQTPTLAALLGAALFWKECDALASVEAFLVPVPEVSAGLGLTSQHDQRCMLMAPCIHVAVSAAHPVSVSALGRGRGTVRTESTTALARVTEAFWRPQGQYLVEACFTDRHLSTRKVVLDLMLAWVGPCRARESEPFLREELHQQEYSAEALWKGRRQESCLPISAPGNHNLRQALYSAVKIK